MRLACIALVGLGFAACSDPQVVTAELPSQAQALPMVTAEAVDDPSEARRAEDPQVIELVVLGSFPDDLLDAVDEALRDEYGVQVVRHGVEPLPASAFYRPRRRYRADRLLEHLLTFVEEDPPHTRALGLTSKDISTTKGKHFDWGIFGLGYTPGRAAVVSSRRLRKGAKDREHLRFRVANTAIHEVGHMFGLPHCEEERCPMRDAHGGIASTDDSSAHLGPQCRAWVDAQLR